jgi:hypothetical protein
MEKYGVVYIWYDNAKSKQNGPDKIKKFYIGGHWGTEDDGYICSSDWMRKAYRRRPQDFKRRIIYKTLDKKDLWDKEHRLLKNIKSRNKSKYYNRSAKHQSDHTGNLNPMYGKHHTEESKKLISENHSRHNKGKSPSVKTRLKSSKTHKENYINGKQISYWLGKERSEETKLKISKSRKGVMTGESHFNFGKKLSYDVWNKDKKNCYSEETIEKMRQSKLGKKQSQKHIEKRRKSFIPKNKIKIIYKYLIFDSITEASNISNIPITTLRRWCKSYNYPNWNEFKNKGI